MKHKRKPARVNLWKGLALLLVVLVLVLAALMFLPAVPDATIYDTASGLAFAEGMGALELSRKLERFLLPNRANLRTNRPYGTSAAFDAMRLARTEIARAANQAAFLSSYLNLYVDKIDVARSGNGDKTCAVSVRVTPLSAWAVSVCVRPTASTAP